MAERIAALDGIPFRNLDLPAALALIQETTWGAADTCAQPSPDRPNGVVIATTRPEAWKTRPVCTLDLDPCPEDPRASQVQADPATTSATCHQPVADSGRDTDARVLEPVGWVALRAAALADWELEGDRWAECRPSVLP
ncbi:hypothetical protein [Streptomyces sp. NPDC006285]|uniref:hypothetical protein n=1 Tax=Streptomyces sp. NPDC006285 TaxID=3364742 RepID=UPI003675C8F6